MEDSFDRMVRTIPGFTGKREDYCVSIAEQRAFLESLPPRDRFWNIASAIARKNKAHKRIKELSVYLAEQNAIKQKNDDHLRQLAVKWCREK